MNEKISDDINKDLEKVCILHERAASDYDQCMEFSKLMSDILEDVQCYQAADKVMSILLNCTKLVHTVTSPPL